MKKALRVLPLLLPFAMGLLVYATDYGWGEAAFIIGALGYIEAWSAKRIAAGLDT